MDDSRGTTRLLVRVRDLGTLDAHSTTEKKRKRYLMTQPNEPRNRIVCFSAQTDSHSDPLHDEGTRRVPKDDMYQKEELLPPPPSHYQYVPFPKNFVYMHR